MSESEVSDDETEDDQNIDTDDDSSQDVDIQSDEDWEPF